MKTSRRTFLGYMLVPVGAVAVTGLLAPHAFTLSAGVKDAADSALVDVDKWRSLSKAEWAARLTPEQFHILRKEGTERAYTSVLNKESRAGTFHCAGCDLALFSSDTKYDSGTGWPSFYAPVDEKYVAIRIDSRLFLERTEVHCARCLGHLGHIFEDGPPPTRLRYCINGDALAFHPKA